MAITMAAVQQGFLNVLQKNVATKLARKSFKQYRVSIISSTGKYLFVQSDNTRLSITLGNIQVLQNKK